MSLIILRVLIVVSMSMASCFAHTVDNLPPMHKKNLNEVTDFFPAEISDKAAVERDANNYKAQSEGAILNNSVLPTLPGNDKFEETASSLGDINQSDAESKGQQIQAAESSLWEKAHINYEDPQVIEHKKDTDNIVKGSEDLFRRLAEQLKERFNIDCKQKNGPELEPEMYIELEQTQEKEITYDGFLCEYLRNRYNCRDNLSLTCKLKGMRWNPWQDREISLDGKMLYHSYTDWGWSVKWKKKRHGWHISGARGPESSLTPEQISFQVRQFIANSLGVSIEQINEVIGFPPGGRGIGNITPLYSRWRVAWDQYVFKYKYRDGYLDCFDWQEKWDEKCTLE